MSDALEESIEHWQRLVSGERQQSNGERTGLESVYADDCPLCALYLDQPEMPPCEGCPVFARTGIPGCEGTPWTAVAKIVWDGTHAGNPEAYLIPEFKEAAQRELDFLISLRTPKPQPPTLEKP